VAVWALNNAIVMNAVALAVAKIVAADHDLTFAIASLAFPRLVVIVILLFDMSAHFVFLFTNCQITADNFQFPAWHHRSPDTPQSHSQRRQAPISFQTAEASVRELYRIAVLAILRVSFR
jgi:hypothetical protein